MNTLFGRKTNTKRALSHLMMTSALVAAGTLVLSSSAMAAAPGPWNDVTGLGFTNTSGGVNTTNIVATTANGKASGTGNLDILNGQTVNINAKLFVARDNRPTIQTQILGQLNSNGTVVLIDRNGIIFGKNSRLDVGSLIASTGDLDNNQALADGDAPLFFSNFGTGTIENNGVIKAVGTAGDYGLVAFVGPVVKNNGVINAYMGRVSLAAGNETATVDLYGDGLVSLAYTDKNDALLAENNGVIQSFGGKIQMTAAAAKDVVDSVVNMKGVARANSATVVGGKIILSAKKVNVGAYATVKGNTTVTAKAVKLGTTIDGTVSGSADKVKVLSDKAKIAQGLNIINTNGTIDVAAGTYNEHLVVDKAGVTINGANKGVSGNGVRGAETIINPMSPGFTVTADNVTIDGMSIANALGADGYGLYVTGADNVTLKNNVIKNTSQSGIYILNSNNATITDNNVGATGAAGNIQVDGIRLVRGNNAAITGNTVSNVGTEGTGTGSGIYAVLSNGLNISGNTVSNTVWDGVKLVGSNDAVVEKNTITNVGRAGVSVAVSNDVTVQNNILTNSGYWGVWAQASKGLDILRNNIDGVKTEHGVYVDGGDAVVISGNTINDTKLSGIHVDNALTADMTSLMIDENIISNTGSHGVWVYGAAGATVSSNLIGQLGNIGGDGIRIIGSNGSVVIGNRIASTIPAVSNGSGSGIYSLMNDNIVITMNDVSNTAWDGIKIQGGNANLVAMNTISNVGRAGVAAYQTTGSQISQNSITNAAQWGIWSARNDGLFIWEDTIDGVKLGEGVNSFDDANLRIDHVTISDTKGSGIFVDSATTMTSDPSALLTGNKIDNTGSHGIYVLSSDNADVRYNLIGTAAKSVIEGDGVRAVYSNGLKVHGNIISNVAPVGNGFGSGIYVNYSNDVGITFNRISNTKWDGVKIGFGDKNRVIGNEISDIVRAGISSNDTTNAFIAGNTLSDLGRWGVWSYSNDGEIISGNTISNVALFDGITSENDSNSIFRFNTISGSARDGIYALNAFNGLTILGNTISNSAVNGVEVAEASGLVTIDANTISNSVANGIYVHNASGMLKKFVLFGGEDITLNISGNDISFSNIGVKLESINGDLNVTGNTITNSNYDGVYAQNVNQDGNYYPYPTLFAQIEGEGEGDVVAPLVRQLTIANNDIDNSGSNGIELDNVGGLVTVDSNYITNSGYNGILAYNDAAPIYVGGDDYIGGEYARQAFFAEDYYYGSTPIELHIVNNTIENFASIDTEVFERSEQKVKNTNFFGFAAVNVDVSGDGYAELSGNTLGNNFEYGLVAYSGSIDLTGATNTIQNTNIGMGFYPTEGSPESDSAEYFDYLASQLSLVNDTIGTTAFIDQSELFVDLGYGAMYAPGTPTQLDGNSATYTLAGVTIDPAANGGVTSDEYDVLESFINHYVDAQNRGQFFFNILPPVSAARTIDQKDVIRDTFGIPTPQLLGGNLTITGLPLISTTGAGGTTPTGGFNPAAIEPAAGDETADAGTTPAANDVANIQPAAGGDTACWSDATASLGQGAPVTFNYGATGTALLQNAASCGTGQAQGQSL